MSCLGCQGLFGVHGLYRSVSLSLLVSSRCPSLALLKNALSFFLRQVILDTGAVEESALPPCAHSVRAVATSAVFLRSFLEVLEAATWRSNPVFASFISATFPIHFNSCHSLELFVVGGFGFAVSTFLVSFHAFITVFMVIFVVRVLLVTLCDA